MNKLFGLLLFGACFFYDAAAQGRFNPNILQGEFGISLGAAHYFGDINTRSSLNRAQPSVGVFYRKQFNNYLAARIMAHWAQLGYSDTYSKNIYQKTRNLSFNTDIFEIALCGDFNFFRFEPGEKNFIFTPFISLGVGMFSFNPYAYLEGKKVYLRPLGTEGQNIGYTDPNTGVSRKPYGSMSVCVPIAMGIKYNINERFNFTFQIGHRLTFTDYLDDVSTTYVGSSRFVQGSNAWALQDRSLDKGNPIGIEGRQRGWSKQNDQYIIAEVGFSFNIMSYKCPSDF